tara:strand:- start:16766 stop:18076 length:1311 start_codon:yes stop_codon:yes gene_type:complete
MAVKKSRLKVGIGTSINEDAVLAADEAAKAAIQQCGGKPNFSIVYVDSKYNPKKVLKGFNGHLGKNWIGCSTDSQSISDVGYFKGGISVISIKSEHLHFGVGYVENYKKNPIKSGEAAIKKALDKVKIDQYLNPYVQFRRVQTKKFEDIVRTPPYFILSMLTGVQSVAGKQEPGRETGFVEGIFNVTGPNIPVIGGSASSDLDKFLKENKTNIFHFAEGKLLKNAAITVFVVSDLYFSTDVEHGYTKSKEIALVTKIDETGHEILEINNKPSLAEYARLVGITKEQLLKDPFKYTFQRPLGVIDTNGYIFIKEWMPNEDGKTMHSLMKVVENSAVNVVNYDKSKTIHTIKNCFDIANKRIKGKDPALALLFNCCGRKPLLGKDVKIELNSLVKKHPKLPTIGFHTFGEIGSKPNAPPETVNQSLSMLILYDALLTD